MTNYVLMSGDPNIGNNFTQYCRMPGVGGLGLRAWWTTVEPSKDAYNFKPILDGLRVCREHGKRAHVTITCGIHSPKYLNVPGHKFVQGEEGIMPHPTDSLAHERWGLLVQEFGKACGRDSTIDFVHVGGPTCHKSNEMYLYQNVPKDQMVAAWRSELIVFAQNFDCGLCLNVSKAYTANDGIPKAVVDMAVRQQPKRLRLQHNQLSAKTTTTNVNEKLMAAYPQVPNGREMLSASKESRFGGSWEKAVRFGTQQGAQWITSYKQDAAKL